MERKQFFYVRYASDRVTFYYNYSSQFSTLRELFDEKGKKNSPILNKTLEFLSFMKRTLNPKTGSSRFSNWKVDFSLSDKKFHRFIPTPWLHLETCHLRSRWKNNKKKKLEIRNKLETNFPTLIIAPLITGR